MRRWTVAVLALCGCGASHHVGADAAGTADGMTADARADVPSAMRGDADDGRDGTAGRSDATDAEHAPDATTSDAVDSGDAEAGSSCDGGDAGLPSAAGTWQAFGAPLGDSASSPLFWPALTLLPDDSPVVSWFEGTGIQTRIWRATACGGEWTDPGGAITGDSPTLTIDAQGAPILAFDDYTATPAHVSVVRFDGAAFVPLGGPLPSTNHGAARAVAAPALAADALGSLVLGWVDFPSSSNATIQVARWNGAAWLAMTDANGALGLLGSGSPSGPSLALTPDGGVIASWLTTGHATAVARYMSGTTWTAVGTPPSGAAGGGENNGPLVVVDKTGTIDLAWKDRTAASTYHTFAAQYDGTTWKPLGAAVATAGSADGDYALMVDATNAPVVMNPELLTPQPGSSGFNYRWNGATWESPAPVLPVAASVSSISAPRILSDRHGRWVAAWLEYNASGTSVQVARWQP